MHPQDGDLRKSNGVLRWRLVAILRITPTTTIAMIRCHLSSFMGRDKLNITDVARLTGRRVAGSGWTNFEFIDDEGKVSEVDALVLSPAGLFLVEIKSRPCSIDDDGIVGALVDALSVQAPASLLAPAQGAPLELTDDELSVFSETIKFSSCLPRNLLTETVVARGFEIADDLA